MKRMERKGERLSPGITAQSCLTDVIQDPSLISIVLDDRTGMTSKRRLPETLYIFLSLSNSSRRSTESKAFEKSMNSAYFVLWLTFCISC